MQKYINGKFCSHSVIESFSRYQQTVKNLLKKQDLQCKNLEFTEQQMISFILKIL